MSEEKKVMCHVFLIAYASPAGFGSFVNYREAGVATDKPTADDIDSMMSRLAKKSGFPERLYVPISVSSLEDKMVAVTDLDF